MRRSYLLYNNPLLFIILYFWEKCKCRFSEDVRRQWESILEHLILLLFERSRFSFDPSARDRIDDRDLCPRKLIAARHTRWRGETASNASQNRGSHATKLSKDARLPLNWFIVIYDRQADAINRRSSKASSVQADLCYFVFLEDHYSNETTIGIDLTMSK